MMTGHSGILAWVIFLPRNRIIHAPALSSMRFLDLSPTNKNPMNTSSLKSFAPAVRRQLMEAVGRRLDYVLGTDTPDHYKLPARSWRDPS
jgi:hypothetical protein